MVTFTDSAGDVWPVSFDEPTRDMILELFNADLAAWLDRDVKGFIAWLMTDVRHIAGLLFVASPIAQNADLFISRMVGNEPAQLRGLVALYSALSAAFPEITYVREMARILGRGTLRCQ